MSFNTYHGIYVCTRPTRLNQFLHASLTKWWCIASIHLPYTFFNDLLSYRKHVDKYPLASARNHFKRKMEFLAARSKFSFLFAFSDISNDSVPLSSTRCILILGNRTLPTIGTKNVIIILELFWTCEFWTYETLELLLNFITNFSETWSACN